VSRRLPSALLAFTAAVAAGARAQPPHAAAPAAPADRPGAAAHAHATMGVHGMFVVGRGDSGRVVLAHLPLYRAPHDRQLLVVARLRGGTPTAATGGAAGGAAARALAGGGAYTVEPERFPLARLWPVGPSAVRFRGTLYRGHFERGGHPVLRDVGVEVERVLVSEPLRAAGPTAPRASTAGTPAYLFAVGGELFLAHRIAGAPSFDQVVALDAPAAGRSPLARRARDGAVPVVVAPEGGGAAGGTTGEATGAGAGADRPLHAGARVRIGDGRRTFRARVAREEYLEFDDLRPPAGPGSAARPAARRPAAGRAGGAR
jgi:hypothetical protein